MEACHLIGANEVNLHNGKLRVGFARQVNRLLLTWSGSTHDVAVVLVPKFLDPL
jgi:hypothetical protein